MASQVPFTPDGSKSLQAGRQEVGGQQRLRGPFSGEGGENDRDVSQRVASGMGLPSAMEIPRGW